MKYRKPHHLSWRHQILPLNTYISAGWEVCLDGSLNCENFIATQITNKETFHELERGIELIFRNDRLEEVFDYEDGIMTKQRYLRHNEKKFHYKAFPENSIFAADKESGEGFHQIGGEIPADFSIPENNCEVPFQYLGFINHEDPLFNWLPFTLHLTCPIFLNIEETFIDYSDPAKPVVLNREFVDGYENPFGDELNKNTEFVYEALRFDFKIPKKFSGWPGVGHAGIPKWIQGANIPTCPKSGNRMKFVCQLGGGVKTKLTNVASESEMA